MISNRFTQFHDLYVGSPPTLQTYIGDPNVRRHSVGTHVVDTVWVRTSKGIISVSHVVKHGPICQELDLTSW